MGSNEYLFSKVDWFSVDQNQRKRLADEVATIDGDRLLNTAVDDLCDYFERKYRIEVPSLQRDEIIADQHETKIDTMNPPRGLVQQGVLILRIEGTDLSPDRVRSEINATLADIEIHLDRLRENAHRLNGQLNSLKRDAINGRRQKLLADRSLVAALGFKMKERDGSGRTYAAPEVRRKLVPTLPPASGQPYKPEPVLSDADYDHILNVVQNMAHVMERSPSAFVGMDEEALRSHFLVQLNGHYEGQATGETFNYQGKTDILIRSEGRNTSSRSASSGAERRSSQTRSISCSGIARGATPRWPSSSSTGTGISQRCLRRYAKRLERIPTANVILG